MSEVKRSANFTSKEESILLCLVRKYKAILENKKTDSTNNKNKLECWKEIEKEFNNESGHTFRDSATLRKKYDNLKKRTKKKLADEKCYALGTGGGPPKKPPEITDIDFEIKEILGERIDGLPSEFGGDEEIITIINEQSDIFDSCDEDFNMGDKTKDMYTLHTDASVDETAISNKISNFMDNHMKPDWSSKNTAQNLRTPTSKTLTVGDGSNSKRKRNEYDAMCSKVTHWAASKANLESEKIRFAEKEHEQKIELMRRKCELECELMRKETEARIKSIEQETEVNIENMNELNKLKKEILFLEKHVMIQKIKNTST